jgi:hypothetical protein
LTGVQVDCTMNTSLLLTFALTSIETYPSLNLPTFISPNLMFKISEISSARDLLEFPLNTTILFLSKKKGVPELLGKLKGDVLMVVELFVEFLF